MNRGFENFRNFNRYVRRKLANTKQTSHCLEDNLTKNITGLKNYSCQYNFDTTYMVRYLQKSIKITINHLKDPLF